MKKILSAMMVLVMLLAVLSSCATVGSGNTVTTSGTNTAVTLKFTVGTETLYTLNVTVNGDAPVVMDAVKTAMVENTGIQVSQLGDKVAAVDTYKDCTLEIEGKDVSFYWNYKLNDKAANKANETAIKEGDVIEFVFTRGSLNENNKIEETPYDPSTNEYYDPDAATTGAA